MVITCVGDHQVKLLAVVITYVAGTVGTSLTKTLPQNCREGCLGLVSRARLSRESLACETSVGQACRLLVYSTDIYM